MQRVVALLARKEQTMLGPVGAARVAAPRTGLTGVIGIRFDSQAACHGRLVREQLLQFRKGPLARVPIGTACLLRHGEELFAAARGACGAGRALGCQSVLLAR